MLKIKNDPAAVCTTSCSRRVLRGCRLKPISFHSIYPHREPTACNDPTLNSKATGSSNSYGGESGHVHRVRFSPQQLA